MHERDLEPEHPLPRLAVDQLRPSGSEVCNRSTNVGDLVGDVVHARAALGEEPANRSVVAERCEQLNPPVADPDRRGFDSLVVDAGAMLELTAEEALVRSNCLVEVRNCNPDVVDAACLHTGDATAGGSGAVA